MSSTEAAPEPSREAGAEPEQDAVLQAVGVRKSFQIGDRRLEILHGVDIALARGEPPPVLTDPWSPSGDPIRWRRDGDAHFLWSVGCDRRNDQGAYDTESTEEWKRILSRPKPGAILDVGDVTVRLRLPHTAAARAGDAPPK